jgi:hypothetical protein
MMTWQVSSPDVSSPAFDGQAGDLLVATLVAQARGARDDDATSISGYSMYTGDLAPAAAPGVEHGCSGSEGTKGEAQHTVKVSVRSVRATLLTSPTHELLHVASHELLCAVRVRGVRPGGVAAPQVLVTGTLGSVDVRRRHDPNPSIFARSPARPLALSPSRPLALSPSIVRG